MKTVFLFLGILLAFSCNSDDDSHHVNNGLHNPYTGSVVGSWIVTGINANGEEVNPDCNLEEDESFMFHFYENGTFETYNNCGLQEPLSYQGTYSTTGNVLTLTIEGYTGKAHMIDLEENRLAFRFTIGFGGLFYGYEFRVLRAM